jgi:hypothetical protein
VLARFTRIVKETGMEEVLLGLIGSADNINDASEKGRLNPSFSSLVFG